MKALLLLPVLLLWPRPPPAEALPRQTQDRNELADALVVVD